MIYRDGAAPGLWSCRADDALHLFSKQFCDANSSWPDVVRPHDQGASSCNGQYTGLISERSSHTLR